MSDTTHRVLVVEDEFASLEVLDLLLTGEGFAVSTAADGQEALEALANGAFDIVITDYNMPRMNGLELCERMLLDPRLLNTPVIFTSATYQREMPTSKNVRAFLSKPLLFSELLENIVEILSGTVPAPPG